MLVICYYFYVDGYAPFVYIQTIKNGLRIIFAHNYFYRKNIYKLKTRKIIGVGMYCSLLCLFYILRLSPLLDVYGR